MSEVRASVAKIDWAGMHRPPSEVRTSVMEKNYWIVAQLGGGEPLEARRLMLVLSFSSGVFPSRNSWAWDLS